MTSPPATPPDGAWDPEVRRILGARMGFLFAKLHHLWSTSTIEALRDAGLGLSGLHMGALSTVDRAGPMSQQSLGEHLKKDRTSIVAIVDDLEAEGLIERHRNPEDRRAYALEVTAKGRDWLEQAGPLLEALDDRLLAELTADERRTLADLLQRVLLGPEPSGSVEDGN